MTSDFFASPGAPLGFARYDKVFPSFFRFFSVLSVVNPVPWLKPEAVRRSHNPSVVALIGVTPSARISSKRMR
jgi:hypothetical protein